MAPAACCLDFCFLTITMTVLHTCSAALKSALQLLAATAAATAVGPPLNIHAAASAVVCYAAAAAAVVRYMAAGSAQFNSHL